MSSRHEILMEADRLINGVRDSKYGTPYQNHKRIADLWGTFLEIEITPAQAAACMALVKFARLIETPDHLDSFIDAAGYIAISGEIALGQEDNQ